MKLFSGCIKIIGLLCIFTGVYAYQQLFVPLRGDEQVHIVIQKGESVASLAEKLEEQDIIRSAWVFRKYLQIKNLDKKIQAGSFTLEPPFNFSSLSRILLEEDARDEKELTLLPGWTNRNIAAYLSLEGYGEPEEIEKMIGISAEDYRVNPQHVFSYDSVKFESTIPEGAGYEGYIAPDTFRVFVEDSVEVVLKKFLAHREEQLTDEMFQQAKNNGRTMHEVIILASILEREVQHEEDMARVADLFWRRLDNGWALQADSSVHYLTGKSGDVFTTAADRNIDSPWNTYKYSGLPLGPISHPSLGAIQAALNPEANEYWYFLTTLDTGEVKYGRTLEEHNANVQKYLR